MESPKEVVSPCQCDQCGFKTNYSSELERHIQEDHNVKDPAKIHERFETSFAMKGMAIKENQAIQTGGGGRCEVG